MGTIAGGLWRGAMAMIAAGCPGGDQCVFARPYCRSRGDDFGLVWLKMLRRVVPLLAIFLVAATSVHAQTGPGGGRGGRGGGRTPPSSGGSPTTAAAPAPKPPKPENQIVIVGVVTAIDLDAQRITIAYDAVDELNWPHGTMPFAVYKPDLLKTVTVGERVRFKLDSQRITELTAAPPSRPPVARPLGLP